jgi:hypothetical protein
MKGMEAMEIIGSSPSLSMRSMNSMVKALDLTKW